MTQNKTKSKRKTTRIISFRRRVLAKYYFLLRIKIKVILISTISFRNTAIFSVYIHLAVKMKDYLRERDVFCGYQSIFA